MRPRLNSAQNGPQMSQYTNIQLLILDGSQEFQNEIFENFIEILDLICTKLTLEIKITTLEMTTTDTVQLARDPSNCIRVEYQLPLAGTGPKSQNL